MSDKKSALIKYAAKCAKLKWQFDFSHEGEFFVPKHEFRKAANDAFRVLHELGHEMNKEAREDE